MQDIQCSGCNITFTPKHKRQRWCPAEECKAKARKEAWLKWNERNPTGQRDSSRRYRERNGNTPWPSKRALGLEVTALREASPCQDCGQFFPAECMDFDHRPGEIKVNNVGTMVTHGHNRDRVMAEIAKCDLVCANCHRTRTKNRRNGKVNQDA